MKRRNKSLPRRPGARINLARQARMLRLPRAEIQAALREHGYVHIREEWKRRAMPGLLKMIQEQEHRRVGSSRTARFGVTNLRRLRLDRRLMTCIRRKIRKAVLHALQIAGKKHGSGKSYRRTMDSEYRC